MSAEMDIGSLLKNIFICVSMKNSGYGAISKHYSSDFSKISVESTEKFSDKREKR